MLRRCSVTVAIIFAGAAAVSGQDRTADGIAALARGDYQRAVEILKPIAEDWRSQDTAAQFFMAGLYETGHGVATDALRACALYARAASGLESPFGRPANPLFIASMQRSQEFGEECQRLATVGLDNNFEPATFQLGPGHSVEWTLGTVTVTYEGRTRREPTIYAQPGARFFPLKYTELTTGPQRLMKRHFVDAFEWLPQGTSDWALHWHLFEVVGDEVIRIDTPDLMVTVHANPPPAPNGFDVHEYATVRVDDDGCAEWAVLKGPRSARERIETDTERRETRDARAAHDAALKRVDWNRRADVHRQPTLTYVDGEGCGYFHILGWTADRDELIVVRANLQDLGLQSGAATFDLTRNSAQIAIDAYLYAGPQRHFNFCTDVILREEGAIDPEIWHAIAGTVSIELAPRGTRQGPRATVTLTNVVLRSTSGTLVKVSRPVTLSAIVGAVFG